MPNPRRNTALKPFKPTPLLLTDDDCGALKDQLIAKADSLPPGDPARAIWDEALRMLHDARMASFARRSAERRKRHRKALGFA